MVITTLDPLPDQETNVRDWTKPFASQRWHLLVAFMMELAPHMKELKTEVGVDFVIFDGEEFIHDRIRDKFFWLRLFLPQYRKAKDGPKYKAGILLDLFAGKGLQGGAEFRVAGRPPGGRCGNWRPNWK